MTESSSLLRYVPYTQAFDTSFEDMSRRVPDISKIQRLVGFQPKVQLSEIIERVIEFWTPEQSRGAALVAPAAAAASSGGLQPVSIAI